MLSDQKKWFLVLLVMLSCLVTSCVTAPRLFVAQDYVAENKFTNGVEGPAVDRDGNLYAVNFAKQGTVGIVDSEFNSALFIELPSGSIGNGIRFDKDGDMYIADYTGHNILKVDMATKSVSVHAHNKSMNQPNDIAIAPNGTLYASDPNWAESSGQLWKIDLDGTTTLLEKNMGTTNGVEVSPDGKRLYVNESVQRNVFVYDILDDGKVTNKRLLIRFDNFGMDGMRTDKKGNIYIARYGAGVVAVVSPAGKLLREIPLTGKFPTNVAFGGEGNRQVYVTMQKRGNIETFFNDIPGRSYW